jgi:hypothetical protein
MVMQRLPSGTGQVGMGSCVGVPILGGAEPVP